MAKDIELHLNLPVKELVESVYNRRINRLHESVIGKWTDELKIKSGTMMRKNVNYKGISMITKIRTGTLMFTQSMVRLGILPA